MAELDVTINAGRAQQGARMVRSAMDEIRRTAQGMAAGLYTVERGLGAIWSMTDKAASFEESWRRLTIQTNGFHSSAQLVINDLKAVTNGQLSIADATQVASRGLAEGLSPDHLRTFATAADALSDVMGTDLKTSYDSILQSIATGRTQMLANIGVYVDLEKEVKQLAVSTNRTTDQITKQERAMIAATAVTRQLDTALGKMADSAVSEADKLKAIEARFDDMTLSVGRFSKSLVVATADFFKWMEATRHDTSINPFAAANQAVRQSTPGHMESPGFQEILGRSIVADTQGNLARRAADEARRLKAAANAPLDPKLQALQLQGNADRARAGLESDLARTSMGLEHQSTMYGLDQKLGWQSEAPASGALDLMKSQHEAQLRELAFAGETQNKILELEATTYRKRVAIGFDSTQDKMQAEEAYRTKVVAINDEIAKITQEFGNKSREFEAEQAIQKGVLQEQLGQRLTEQAIAQYKIEVEEKEKLQEQLGQRLTDHFISNFKIGEDTRHREQDETIKSIESRMALYDAYGTSRENQLTAEYDLVRANLAKQLDVTYDTAAKVLNAWRSNDFIHANELLESTGRTWDQVGTIVDHALAKQRDISEKYSDDFFGGFAKSMKKYVNDTSVFGLGIDQARRVAQGMEQGFGRFFFDAMEGRIQSFKDVVQGLTDFAKSITSQLAGTLITNSILQGARTSLPSLFGGFTPGSDVANVGGGLGSFNAGGSDFLVNLPGPVKTYSRGGISNIPAIFGEAGTEAAVPLPDGRSIPVKWMGNPYVGQMTAPQVSVPVKVEVYNSNSGQTEVQTQSQRGTDGSQTIKIFVKQVVKEGFANGDFNKEMATYGARLQPIRR